MDFAVSVDSSNSEICYEFIDFSKFYARNFLNSAHGMHKYTAKMTPPISRYLIEKYSTANDLILDPFCGSGTTLLESCLLGRRAVGIDINPLARLISKVKTTQIKEEDLTKAIDQLILSLRATEARVDVDFPNVDYWFGEQAKDELSRIKYCLEAYRKTVSGDIFDFFLVAFSSIIRKSSFADLRMAKTYKSKRVLKKVKDGWMPAPIKLFEHSLKKNEERLISTISDKNLGKVKSFSGDARNASDILVKNKTGKVDLIITSPPYINAQDYFRSYKLELWWTGLLAPEEIVHLKRKAIGTEYVDNYDPSVKPAGDSKSLTAILSDVWNKDKMMSKQKAYMIKNYFDNMKVVFNQMTEALKTGGILCLVSGNNTICGIEIPTFRILIELAEQENFKSILNYRDAIKNRSLFPSRNHEAGVIRDEWVTIFKKL